MFQDMNVDGEMLETKLTPHRIKQGEILPYNSASYSNWQPKENENTSETVKLGQQLLVCSFVAM